MVEIPEGELLFQLPDATMVYSIEQFWTTTRQDSSLAHVDWAWDEPASHFLLEVKDPECTKARRHNLLASEKQANELGDSEYLTKLAAKAANTARLHTPSSVSGMRAFLVLVAVEALDAAALGAASDRVAAELERQIGSPKPVVVANIEQWNRVLSPRRVQRSI